MVQQKPEQPGPGATPPPQLSFKMTPAVGDRLAELIGLVREAGHARPSQKTLVQALIQAAPRDGAKLEMEVLVPYRQANPDED